MPEPLKPAPEFVCPDCGRTFAAAISLTFCCNRAALGRYGADADS